MSETITTTTVKPIKPRLRAAVPKAGMVLAAGLGTRMAELSQDRPKAMVSVAGRTLIDRVLDRYAAAGVEQAVVNLHAHADLLQNHLTKRAAGPEIVLSDERAKLLETGGGVRKALDLIDADPFFVANCDALWLDGMTDTLQLMAQAFDPDKMDALLLIVPSVNTMGYDGTGDFEMAATGQLRRKKERTVSPFVFGGVAMYKKAAIEPLPLGEKCSLNRVFDALIPQGRLYGAVHEGRWAHVGTPHAVRETERRYFG